MSKRLNPYDVAILRGAWLITPEDKKLLDAFFLQHTTWSELKEKIYRDDAECKRFIMHEGKEYEVILMQPVRQIEAAKKLGLSFRVNNSAQLRVVLIREWYDVEETVS